MSPRARILTLVWLVAAAAAAVVIGATLLQSQSSSASADAELPEGNPPLVLDLGPVSYTHLTLPTILRV